MPDLLAQLWALVTLPFSDPRISAAVPAFVLSWLIGNRSTAFTCAVFAFCTINLIIWLSAIPFGGEYELPVEAASGVGAGMAFMGVHGLQDRVRSFDINTVVRAIINAIKGGSKR